MKIHFLFGVLAGVVATVGIFFLYTTFFSSSQDNRDTIIEERLVELPVADNVQVVEVQTSQQFLEQHLFTLEQKYKSQPGSFSEYVEDIIAYVLEKELFDIENISEIREEASGQSRLDDHENIASFLYRVYTFVDDTQEYSYGQCTEYLKENGELESQIFSIQNLYFSSFRESPYFQVSIPDNFRYYKEDKQEPLSKEELRTSIIQDKMSFASYLGSMPEYSLEALAEKFNCDGRNREKLVACNDFLDALKSKNSSGVQAYADQSSRLFHIGFTYINYLLGDIGQEDTIDQLCLKKV